LFPIANKFDEREQSDLNVIGPSRADKFTLLIVLSTNLTKKMKSGARVRSKKLEEGCGNVSDKKVFIR
jgi:hypothetical protein